MKKLFLFFIIVFFSSCQFFEKQIPSEKELLEKQINEINWKEVDEYPSISECDKLADADQRKKCFFELLTSVIQEKLNVDTLSILYPKLDTIEVKVTVYPNSSIEFKPQFPKDSIAYDTIKIDSILHVKLKDFPKINPAIKHGIPVKTQFILPVILKSNK